MNLYENIKSNLNESKHGSDYLNGDMVNYFCNEYYKHEDEPHKWTKKEMKDWIIDDQKYCKSNNTDSLFTLEHLDNLLDLQHDLYKSDLEESEDELDYRASYKEIYGDTPDYTELRQLVDKLSAIMEQASEDGVDKYYCNKFKNAIGMLADVSLALEDFYENKD